MDILAMLTGTAALPGALLPGTSTLAAPMDANFAALVEGAPPPVAAPITPAAPASVELALPTPEAVTAPELPAAPKGEALMVDAPKASPKAPRARPDAIPAEPLPLVMVAAEDHVAPKPAKAIVETPDIDAEAPPPAEPVLAEAQPPVDPLPQATTPPLPPPVTTPRPVAQRPEQVASKPDRAEPAPSEPRDRAEPTPPGFARVALTPAAEHAAPEAAFRVEAAPLPPATPLPAAAPLASPIEAASAPVATAPAEPAQRPQPSVALGHDFGERMGLAIARRVGEGGDELVVRMEPAELGRIQVRLAFDEQGSLRAVLSAESSQVMEALRRDAGDLARALGDAGVRTDGQSFRFDSRGSQAGEQGHAAWTRWQNQQQGQGRMAAPGDAEEIAYRPVRRSGRLDLTA
jgi:flagellar hook-length control protein FliK